ncbi:MAG: hypothetical protein ACLP9L_12370 [Thermoguttaceae bacterium]
MELQLKFIGVSLIVLALVHAVFPKYFQWNKDLAGLKRINRQMMYVHAFFVALTVFLMGVLCLTSSFEITGTPLGKKVAFGLAVFWAARLFVQFFGYSSDLWRGKAFETTVHVGFAIFWAYLSAVFTAITWMSPDITV